jgi:hypothetical protein
VLSPPIGPRPHLQRTVRYTSYDGACHVNASHPSSAGNDGVTNTVPCSPSSRYVALRPSDSFRHDVCLNSTCPTIQHAFLLPPRAVRGRGAPASTRRQWSLHAPSLVQGSSWLRAPAGELLPPSAVAADLPPLEPS